MPLDTTKRPLGVTFLAIACFCIAGLLLGLELTALKNPELLWRINVAGFANSMAIRNLRIARFLVLAPMMACFVSAIAIGLWSLKNWARWAILLFTGVGLCRRLMAVILIPIVAPDIKFSPTPGFAISVIFYAAVLYYLMSSEVKRAFGEGTS